MPARSKIEDFDDARREKFRKLLVKGNFREAAAAAVGITGRTLRDWMKRGDDDDEKDPRFAEIASLVTEAEAESEALLLEIIVMAARRGNWQAAAWILERRGAARWTVKQHMTVAAAEDQEPRHVTVVVSPTPAAAERIAARETEEKP